ncbi:AAA ATPase central domain protein [Minicystis rosea]|nr:AAA ATPase central domain protein [Minicystis rosea]
MTADLTREVSELVAAGAAIVYVVTHEETRALAAIERSATALERGIAIWSVHRGLDPTAVEARDPIAALDVLDSEIAPGVAVLLDFHDALRDTRVVRRLRDLLPRLAAEGRAVIIVAPEQRVPEGLVAQTAVVRLSLPDEAALADILDDALHARGADTEADARHAAVRSARGLTGDQAKRAFLRGLYADAALGPAALAAILTEKRRILARDLGLEDVEVLERPEDVGGLEAFKAWLFERAQAMTPDAHRFGLTPPRGVLLVGVQGCGKSLSAKCAAAQLGVPLLRLDLPRVLGAGAEGRSAEESLARALEAAESVAPVALWVDEIEKGFAGTATGRGSDSRAARLLGAFSTWLQERRGAVFVVATANDVTSLPPELLRRGRFDELFFVDLPDTRARRTILGVHLRRRGRDAALYDVAAIASRCENFSGAELEQIVVGGLHRAFAAGRELETADMRYVAEEMVPLYQTYEEPIKALREWAIGRCRSAGRQDAIVDLFRKT